MSLRVGFFMQRYNWPFSTFILRQIGGIRPRYEPIVLTSNKPVIEGTSPDYPIYHMEMRLIERAHRAWKKRTGIYRVLSRRQMRFFEKICTGNKLKIIHAHYGPSAVEILPLAKKLGLPLIVSFHGYDASTLLRDELYVRQLSDVFKYAHIIAVSNNMAQELIRVGADINRVSVIYYGVPARNKFVSRKPVAAKIENHEEIRFLQVSGFEEKKGHVYTVRAFNEFLKYYEKSSLTFVGSGSLLEDVVRLVNEMGLQDKVFFKGSVQPDEVFNMLASADVFVHHSVTARSGDKEGIPNAIMEAMASGLPVVSTLHSGILELIDDGIDGYLVKERDIRSYVEAMKAAVNSDSELPRRASEKVLKSFNLEIQNRKISDLYDKVIGRGDN